MGRAWNHNTAYHPWILEHARVSGRALDVGCGDGLLVSRLSPICAHVTGIDSGPGRDRAGSDSAGVALLVGLPSEAIGDADLVNEAGGAVPPPRG